MKAEYSCPSEALMNAVAESYGYEYDDRKTNDNMRPALMDLAKEYKISMVRVMYFFIVGKQAILTHGFVKKTQETPPAEIDRAKKYRAEYLARKIDKE